MAPSFSIAICTHNPDTRVLARLLKAIQSLDQIESVESVVLVDNNSRLAVSNLDFVKSFLESVPNAKVVLEPNPGKTYAFCRAVNETHADVMVNFDDDNEPARDYLSVLSRYFKKYHHVGIWGPSQIDVEFVDGAAESIQNRPQLFQQRKGEFAFACIPGFFSDSTPQGTGFAVRRDILVHYERLVARGVLSCACRKGSELSSGGDAQIVWEAAKLGYASGVLPELRCRHLINAAKANDRYVGRLTFGMAASHLPALVECYPDLAMSMAFVPTRVNLWKQLIRLHLKSWLKRTPSLDKKISQASLLGAAYGSAIVRNDPRCGYFKSLAKRFDFVD